MNRTAASTHRFHPRPVRSMPLMGFAVATLLAGCASSSDPLSGLDRSDRVVRADRVVAPGGPADTSGTPPAIIAREEIRWEELAPVLAEAAGAAALEEIALTRSVLRELDRQGLRLDASDTRREEMLFAVSVTRSGSVDAEQFGAVLSEVRTSRGLGPTRYRMLLERNAGLRMLVQPEIEITEADLRLAHAVRNGPRRTVRLIVLPTQLQAAELRRVLITQPSDTLRGSFIQAAIDRSIDPTAPRGGLTEPISAADPAYAPAVRRTVEALRPGEVSGVTAVDQGFALMLLEQDLPAGGATFESARSELEASVRLRQERLLMDRLARQLLSSASVTVFNDPLHWSWENRRDR